MSRNEEYKWDIILNECSDILSKNGNIRFVSDLYSKLERRKKDGKLNEDLPPKDTFGRRIKQEVSIGDKRITQYDLYQLVGKYSKIPLDSLRRMCIAEVISSNAVHYLFINVSVDQGSNINNRKYLLQLINLLKNKYKNNILYSSFDNYTIVLMCRNKETKVKICDFINNRKKGEHDGKA